MEINLQSCPSTGENNWQIWLMTEVWNPHSKASWETADAKF